MVGIVLSEVEQIALTRAFDAARLALPHYDANPAVGCTVIAANGEILVTAAHAGSGTSHAEVVALSLVGAAARGATVVITLQPCNHTGKTDPCVDALIAAGVARVVYAVSDPSGHATNSDERMKAMGMDVVADVDCESGIELLGTWGFMHRYQRPHVTWKVAASLDGRIADGAGMSQWITGESARSQVQALRAQHGAVITGTGTVIADNPRLTSRDASGEPGPQQPLRVIVGLRDISPSASIFEAPGECVHLRTRDLRLVLSILRERGIHRVLLECGSALSAAALEASLVDEVVWFAAGMLLGEGQPAADMTSPLSKAIRWTLKDVHAVGGDVMTHWVVPNASRHSGENV